MRRHADGPRKIALSNILGCTMKRSVLVLAVFTSLTLLLSLTFGAATARAQFARGVGTVQGTVLDAHGKPVPEASVTIQTSDGLKPHATHTDSSGHYEFARYDAGTIRSASVFERPIFGLEQAHRDSPEENYGRDAAHAAGKHRKSERHEQSVERGRHLAARDGNAASSLIS